MRNRQGSIKIKASLPKELHTFERVIDVSTRHQIVSVLTALYTDATIRGFSIRALREMIEHPDQTPVIHVIQNADEIPTYVERSARWLDHFDHYQILVHEAAAHPEHVENGGAPARIATVVMEEIGEHLSLAG